MVYFFICQKVKIIFKNSEINHSFIYRGHKVLIIKAARQQKGGENMPNNHGRLREDEMIIQLHGKKVKDLNQNLHYLMEELFGVIEDEEYVSCEPTDDHCKPDFIITYKGQRKGVSMKSASSTSMHNEPISTFVVFLRSLHISEYTINTLLLNQYGDGTTDGTGTERMPLEVLKYKLADDIAEANDELNNDKERVVQIIDRLVFLGSDPNLPQADAIYHGDFRQGTVITRTQVLKYMGSRYFNYYDNLHIGPLFLRPHARYIGKDIKNPEYRHRIDFNWSRLINDMEYISKRFSSYVPLAKRGENGAW